MSVRRLPRPPGRTVVVEEGGGAVRKTFFGDDPRALLRLAEAEFGRLQQFHRALGDVTGAGSPRPIEIRSDPEVVIRMERAPGRPLLDVLRHRDLAPDLVERLAAVAAAAVTRYVDALGEPYADFQFDNMLFDEASEGLTFLDLGPPDGGHPPPPGSPALELTLGNLIGSTVFQSARPRWALASRQHRQAVALCSRIVERVDRFEGRALAPGDLHACAVAAYQRCAFKEGWAGWIWYRSVGYFLARRPRILGLRFSPPRRPRRQASGSPSRDVPGGTNRK